MSETTSVTILVLALLGLVAFGAHECATYSAAEREYRSGAAYHDCIQACSAGRGQ